MAIPHYERFAPVVQQLPLAALRTDPPAEQLLLEREGDLSIYYAPFDVVNAEARIGLVGITPGLQQMQNALVAFRRALDAGSPPLEAAQAAKGTASFSGPMRPNLIAMLDYFKVNQLLGIKSCKSLFGADSRLVYCTSALQFPVFRSGKNYNGSPKMEKHPMLLQQLLGGWAVQAARMPDVVWVPLGGKVSESARILVQRGALDPDRVLDGLEHPSGANNERINYLIGRKRREDLSRQTDPDRIDRARTKMEHCIAALMAST